MTPRTASSVAIEVEMSPRTIKRWCREGKIATVGKLDGSTGAWLIGPEGLEQARLRAAAARSDTETTDAGQIDVDRALLVLASFALGLVAALSPLAVTVYVALIAVCAFSASWLMVHELRERGHLRDPHRDRVLADPADLPMAAARPRVEVGNLDHILIPGPFSRAGIRK